jgi:hypothetical protein
MNSTLSGVCAHMKNCDRKADPVRNLLASLMLRADCGLQQRGVTMPLAHTKLLDARWINN